MNKWHFQIMRVWEDGVRVMLLGMMQTHEAWALECVDNSRHW